jgi:hypothetical protein
LFVFDKGEDQLLMSIEEQVNNIRFYNQSGVKIHKAVQIFNAIGLDYFIIPHIDKSDFLLFEDLTTVEEKLYYAESWEDSTRYKNFLKSARSIVIKPVKFSDHHDWKNDTYLWTGTYLEHYNSFSDLKWNLTLTKGKESY